MVNIARYARLSEPASAADSQRVPLIRRPCIVILVAVHMDRIVSGMWEFGAMDSGQNYARTRACFTIEGKFACDCGRHIEL